jgi:hypothetical protein
MFGFPLLLIPFAIYNIIAILMPDVTWTGVVTTFHMVSGADWTLSAGDLLITLAIVLCCWARWSNRRASDFAPWSVMPFR